MTHRLRIMLSLLLLLAAPIGVRCQVDICYDFEDAVGNSRPVGWGALPNLDYHYVGIDAYDNTAHTGSKSLRNNGVTCFTIMPDEGINYGADSVWLTFWYYLHLNTDWVEVGYLTDATDSSTFHVLDTVHGWQQQWHFAAVDLSSVPTGARMAFLGHDLFCNDGTFWIDDIHLTYSPCAAWGVRVAENREDSVRLEWESAGSPTVTLTVGGIPHSVTGNSYTFARNANNSYSTSLIAQCPVTGCMPIQPYSEVTVYRYREGACLDASDYMSSMATPYYGTPVEPYLSTGTYTTTAPGVSGIYAGSHTLNTNPGSDGGMMVFPRTIPPGDNATLRLGNRLGDWESASMLYTLDVDTNVADILVMKYTVAMAFGTFQGPAEAYHSDTLRPAWFRIELLDDTMAQTPDGCSQFYIDMWDTAGWDEMNNMYKRRDFTGMAFDLSAWHGRRVHLRVTACDGVVNNRWCYAYYNFECIKSRETVSDCEGDSVELSVPYGFRYRWWRDGDGDTIGTERTVRVPIDGSLYCCELTDRFNPSCGHMVSRQVLQGEMVEARDTVVENDLPHIYRGIVFGGAVDTMFTVSAAVGCDTVVHYVLYVWHNQDTRQVLRVCPDEWPVVWQGHTFGGPDSVEVTYTDMHGADSVVTYVTVEAPAYELADTVVICPWRAFVYDSIDYGGPVSFDTVMTTVDGCDSTMHVTLAPRDSAFTPQAWHSIDGTEWADTVPVVLCSNEQLQVRDATQGGTAWHWVLGDTDSSDARQATFIFVRKDSVETVVLTLDVVSVYGCHDTVVWPVVVFPAPEADFEWKPEHPMDVDAQMQLVNNTMPDSCSWLWLIGEDSLTAFAPYYRLQGYTAPGDVEVTLKAMLTMQHDTITHTCSDTAVRQVTIVTCFLQFPTLVTPNGDGINDTWEVVNLVEMGLYPQSELWIYDQWGVLVFHARDIDSHDQCWNPNDRRCPDGTYYFRFMARNKYGIVRQNGIIEVLR